MLGRLPPLAHSLRVLIETLLHGFENVLMFPTGDPSLLPGSAAVLDGAALASIGPVTAQNQPVFLIRVVVGKPFTGRTNVNILCSNITEVLLAEAAIRLRARGHRLWQRHRNVSLLASQNLGAVEVAAISDDVEVVSMKNVLRLQCHFGKL